jgi:uncharacterized membrane protein YeaQ/YmgE (transglycosylase-associated protein family)
MSPTGSMFIGIVGAVVFLLAVFSFGQRNWKSGLVWVVVGLGIIAVLTYLDKPSSGPWR